MTLQKETLKIVRCMKCQVQLMNDTGKCPRCGVEHVSKVDDVDIVKGLWV